MSNNPGAAVVLFENMNWSISVEAPAKINLHLHVYPGKVEGYHELRSLFVMVSLYDELRLSADDHGDCKIIGMDQVPRKENLIWKAWKKYTETTGDVFGVKVLCTKRIPAMSGLGGGSSDAAAMLKCLDLASVRSGRKPLGPKGLKKIAESLGSDVPFFLEGPAALGEGRGEKLTLISLPREYPLVLVRPDPDIATGEAYDYLDKSKNRSDPDPAAEDLVRSFSEETPDTWGTLGFYNSFTPVMCVKYPEIESLIDDLYQKGSAYANMSGSGSAVYGVFLEKKTAEEAAENLKKMRKKVWKLKMLASAPEAVYNDTRLR